MDEIDDDLNDIFQSDELMEDDYSLEFEELIHLDFDEETEANESSDCDTSNTTVDTGQTSYRSPQDQKNIPPDKQEEDKSQNEEDNSTCQPNGVNDLLSTYHASPQCLDIMPGLETEGKTVYQLLSEIAQFDIPKEVLINIVVMLIGQVSFPNIEVTREEKRSKDKLKLRLEQNRAKIIPIILNPIYRINLRDYMQKYKKSKKEKRKPYTRRSNK